LALVCLAVADSYDFGRLFTFSNYSGERGGNVWPEVSNSWVFLLGLLLPIYTITGYDASAHTSEETVRAAHSVPRGMVMSVVWSAIFGYIMLCSFVLMIPDMDQAAAQGWNVFFWAMDAQVNPVVKQILYAAIFVAQFLCGLATCHFRVADDLRLCPRPRAAGVTAAVQREPALPHAGRGNLDRRHPRRALCLVHVGHHHRRRLGLFHRRVLHGDLPVPLLRRADCLGISAYGTSKWPKMGPWTLGKPLFTLVAVLSILSMVLIFFIGISRPTTGHCGSRSASWLLRRSSGSPLRAAASRGRPLAM
jgi:hypothetical protein